MSSPESAKSRNGPESDGKGLLAPSTALVIASSLAVAFAIMGDSLLYAVLPLAAPKLGFLSWQLGVLLSANRLIRLFSNTLLSTLFARFGPYRLFVFSAVFGVITTVFYGPGWGFYTFLAARIGWGISWSGLRQGNFQSIWAGQGSDAGRLIGIMWGIVRGGSAVAAVLGGFLFGHFGYGPTVWTIAVLSALSIPIAVRLSWPPEASPQAGKRSRLGIQRAVQSWFSTATDPLQASILLMGFLKLLLNSVLIATASVFIASRAAGGAGEGAALGLNVGALAGLVLGTRWFADSLLGPFFGGLADAIGRIRLGSALVLLLCATMASMLLLTSSLSIFALLAALIVSSGVNVVLDAYANQAALATPQPQLFVGSYATASDLGSAVGPLCAFSLVSWLGFWPVYAVAAGLVVLAMIFLVAADPAPAAEAS